MDKESWAKKRAKGKKHYLINTGLFKLGTLVGLFTIILKYLRNIDYELGRFDTSSLLQDFVFPYYPITLLIGLVFAWFTWGGFEKRYGDKKEN